MTSGHNTSAWGRASKIARARLLVEINAGNGWCFDGSHRLAHGSAFDVSHIVSLASLQASGVPESEWHRQENLTSSCRKHNRRNGGRVGAKKTNQTKARSAGRTDEW